MTGNVSVQSGTGIVYGPYEFSAKIAGEFVCWLQGMEHPFASILRYTPGTCEFSAMWMDIGEMDPDEFGSLQAEFQQAVLSTQY